MTSEFFTLEDRDAIRAAYRSGHKVITVHGQRFTLRKVTRHPLVTTGRDKDAVHQRQTEHWLVVSPATPGQLTPTANVELVYQGNLRTAVAH